MEQLLAKENFLGISKIKILRDHTGPIFYQFFSARAERPQKLVDTIEGPFLICRTKLSLE